MYKKLSFALVLGLLLTSVAKANLVAWWKLDETSGTIAHDSSGNGNDGTLAGDPQWVAGKSGGALEFNGSSDYIEVPFSESLRVLNQGDFSFAAWFRPDEVPTEYKTIFQQGDDANGGPGRTWLLVHQTNDIRSSLGGAATSSGVSIEGGTWYHAVVVVTEGGNTDSVQVYVNGEPAGASREDGMEDSEGVFYIGTHKALANMWYGLLDDIRIYSHALSEAEIRKLATGPKAVKPDPADGAAYEATWANLSWTAGADAVSHDVYIGESFDDVNAGKEGTFQGNYAATSIVVGFAGFPLPEGLVPGTTYYWRVDEVNDADPNSPWRGDVWSFTVPSKKAFLPTPADGAMYVAPAVALSWMAGFGTKLNHVYFGSDFDEVNKAEGAPAQMGTTYALDTLETNKTYYWRVDEFDGIVTHKGDIWSFTTVPDVTVTDSDITLWWTLDEGEGTTAVDWSGHGNHGTIVGGTQWVDGYHGTALTFGDDVYVEATEYEGVTGTAPRTCCAWMRTATVNSNIMSWGQNVAGQKWRVRIDGTGSLRAEVNGGYHYGVTNIADGQWHHVTVTFEDDGSPNAMDTLLYVDGRLDATAASQDTSIDTAPGLVRIGESPWHNAPFMGQIDDARIYTKVLTQEKILLVMRGDPLLAWAPNPSNGSTPDIDGALPLTWSPGETASRHDVYVGTDRDAIANANASDTTGVYRGSQADTSFTTAVGVEWGGGPYYWRIDEVSSDGTVSKGRIWSFSVADYLIVDDIESYNDLAEDDPASDRIYLTWIDGYGTTTNGSVAGNLDVPLTERSNVHGGAQAMPLSYDNNFKFSEATMTLTAGRDWTRESVAELSLWFRGDAANAAERMYVALNGTTVVYHDDLTAVQTAAWTEWVIPLQQFTDLGVNLTSVTSITIGFGTRGNTNAPGGTGQMYFDDIRLYR